jgi:hypothetical protein
MQETNTEYHKLQVRAKIAAIFGSNRLNEFPASIAMLRFIATLVTRAAWPQSFWTLIVNVTPSIGITQAQLKASQCSVRLQLTHSAVARAYDIVIQAKSEGYVEIFVAGESMSNGTSVDLGNASTLLNIVDNAINKIHDRIVKETWEASWPKNA